MATRGYALRRRDDRERKSRKKKSIWNPNEKWKTMHRGEGAHVLAISSILNAPLLHRRRHLFFFLHFFCFCSLRHRHSTFHVFFFFPFLIWSVHVTMSIKNVVKWDFILSNSPCVSVCVLYATVLLRKRIAQNSIEEYGSPTVSEPRSRIIYK